MRSVVEPNAWVFRSCTGETERTFSCGRRPTPVACVLSQWAALTSWSATCDNGRKTDTRRVVTDASVDAACADVLMEVIICNDTLCVTPGPNVGLWLDWVAAPHEGCESRTILKAANPGQSCASLPLEETEDCDKPPEECLFQWSAWRNVWGANVSAPFRR